VSHLRLAPVGGLPSVPSVVAAVALPPVPPRGLWPLGPESLTRQATVQLYKVQQLRAAARSQWSEFC
jgi:hypothetical protein